VPFSKFFNDPAWQAQISASLELEQRITDLDALLPDYTANIDPELLERMKRLAPSLSALSELEQRITTDSSTSVKEFQHFTDIYVSYRESGEKSVRQFEEQRLYKDKRQKDIAKQAYLEALREHEAEKQVKTTQPQAVQSEIERSCNPARIEVAADLYTRRKINFDEWLELSQPEISNTFIMKVTTKEAFNEVSQADPDLWSINHSSFKRDFWQRYCKETGIKGQSGRPIKK
jgi:hypothetical protein